MIVFFNKMRSESMNIAMMNLCILLLISTILSCKSSFKYSYEKEGLPIFMDDFRDVASNYRADSIIKVVSFNIEFSINIEGATDLLKSSELVDADILLLQEMDEHGVSEIAKALKLSYVYYPSINHPGHLKNVGNAILTKGEIIDTEKIKLPHPSAYPKPIKFKNYLFRKSATVANILLGDKNVLAVSTHAPAVLTTEKRRSFAQALLSMIDDTDADCIIVAGDFNTFGAADIDATVFPFKNDGYSWATQDVGSTVSSVKPLLRKLPRELFQLDHIFVKNLNVLDAGKVIQNGVSDHLPIWVEFPLE